MIHGKPKLRPALPDSILAMTEEEQIARVRDLKRQYGSKLIILGHHYQRESIVAISDFKGDSFALSAQAASQTGARHIVFCGVHFMAESARILASPDQHVYLPNLTAGCPMADMAAVEDVETAWKAVTAVTGPDGIVPVTYMNSSADIKAFCGANGGAVCTSSNARAVFQWVVNAGKRVLFLPDEHLGRNTSNALDIPSSRQVLWNPREHGGGVGSDELEQAQVVLWKGFCHVHTHFTPAHVREMRDRYPDADIIVHPECPQEVVELADGAGSTGYIVKYVADAPAGAVIVIGTEVNLVTRLGHEHPDKIVVPLSRSLCHNMYRINPGNLLYTLEKLGSEIDGVGVNEVIVEESVARDARIALEKMLELA